jgi:Spy/CpxP family protein refolding chaperone
VRHVLLALAVALVACHRDEGEPSPPAAVAATTEPPTDPLPPPAEAPHAPRGPRRSGLAGMIFHAAHDLTLTDGEKAALDELEGPLRAADEEAKGASRGLQSAVVAGIRAGKLDAAKIRAGYAVVDAAAKDRAGRQAEALAGLHALIGTAQRAELTLAVRARLAAHSLRPPDAPEDEASDWTRRRLDRLTDDLDLDDAQRRRVADLLARSALPGPEALKARRDEANARAEAILRAFSHDDAFDAGALGLGAGSDRSPHELVEREVTFLGRLVGVLKPAQRERLATSRERPRAATSPADTEERPPEMQLEGPGDRGSFQ